MDQIFVWTPSDLIGITVVAVMIVCYAGMVIGNAINKSFCKHDAGVNETRACDAICRKCGKNLGFIGSWHKAANNK